MSELIQKNDNRATIRWKLLTGASALALAASVSGNPAKAEDTSHPLIWLELDGQFARQEAGAETFLPPFLLSSQFDAASQIGRTPSTTWNEDAKLTFQPHASDWIFSAAIHIGRNSRRESSTQLTNHATPGYFNYNAFQIFKTSNGESHAIVDFQAGKDFGLGKFGSDGASLLSVGVRYAQFDSRSNSQVRSQPTNVNVYYTFHRFYESFAAKRKFTGAGPSLSWNASAMLGGNPGNGGISLDWGVNGAILFGHQRAQIHHQASNFAVIQDQFVSGHFIAYSKSPVYQHPASPTRSKNVTVPNLGAFAAVSWRTPNAKVSLGYRADMFFNAMDGGIDAAKNENRGFYGPFASISIGIGD